MAKTNAETQRDYRQRQAAGRAELEQLRQEVTHLREENAALQEEPANPQCRSCRGPLACPRCYREQGWE
jgi:cell division protein FtsB